MKLLSFGRMKQLFKSVLRAVPQIAPASRVVLPPPKKRPPPQAELNPAGAKLIRKWMRHKHGGRHTYAKALQLYAMLPDGPRPQHASRKIV